MKYSFPSWYSSKSFISDKSGQFNGTSCSSKYIGVNIVQKKTDKNPAWVGIMRYKGKIVFKCTYKASDIGSDTVKQDLCAINRDIHIREHNLPNKKNFTDKELHNITISYVALGLL